MNFWDKITGNDMTRELQAFEVRAEKLPPDYQGAWEEVKENTWKYSDFSGRNLMSILDGILGLFEEGVAEGQSVEEVVAEDIPGFCAAVAGEEGAKDYRDRWRQQLNDTIHKKLSKLEGEK